VSELSFKKRQRNRLINRLHSLFVRVGITDLEKKDLKTHGARIEKEKLLFGYTLSEALRIDEEVKLLEQHIEILEQEIKIDLKTEPLAKNLLSVPGVGPATAMAFLALKLFKSRVLAFAYLSTLLNGVARGALTFLLIFYLQGIRSMDPLLAGVYLMPFAVAMMVVAPISGALADKYGSRLLGTLGLGLSAIGLLGYTWLRADTSLAQVVFWQIVMGLGSGFFNSPNSNTIMGAVPAERRGIAAGTRTMMNNAGSVISIAMTFAVISSGMTPVAMEGLFAGTQVGSDGIAVDIFMRDVRIAFMISFVISVMATIIAYLRGPEPLWAEPTAEPIDPRKN
jgi:MFS family permease